ncbi:response regulator [Carboxylicivirga sediminis]|uniref:histidine kinase n=1 Tax=Carboxylicivirga sediminis TaxID=2006564 RepID=A0A941IW07_9BACT|nr:two-component regulator propeller domain-containing protein [Carboxylicivirga sediminis]MBR8534044.1 response regulator [Carboxylicivirga sediminis]
MQLRPFIGLIFLFISIDIIPIEATAFSEFKIRNLVDIPENDVNCIYSDSKGFMWIGTLDGLHRYDGYSYKTYRIDNSGISSNMIIAIDEDSQGNIWIGTYGKGICKLNPRTEVFTNYVDSEDKYDHNITNDISALLVDSNDYIWVGNWMGASRVKMDDQMEYVLEVKPLDLLQEDTPTDKGAKVIFEDKDQNIWIGTNIYTYRCKTPYGNLSQEDFDVFGCKADDISDFENGVIAAGLNLNAIVKNETTNAHELKPINQSEAIKVIYHNNTIWTGHRDGIQCLQKNNNNIWTSVKRISHNFSEETLSSNIITWLTKDNLGQIWVGTRGGGVNIISPKPERFKHYRHTPHKGSIANNLTRSIYEDSYQNLWIGTEENGVSVLPNNQNYSNGFRHIRVNNTNHENRVYAIEEMPTPHSTRYKSIIWLGASYPINLVAVNPQTLEPITFPGAINDIGFVFSLEVENDSTLWVGTYNNGLYRFITDKEGVIKHRQNFTPNTPSAISSFIIRSILKDSKGNIWIGTDKGLNKIPHNETHKDNPVIEIYTSGDDEKHLNHDYILQIMEADNSIIWIGTMGGGLIKYNENPNSGDYAFSSVTTRDGLPNNSIKSIVEDEEGNLWLASNKGLSKYNPADGSIINFDKSDGLQENEFSEIVGLKRQNGELVFGGINGFNTFYSKQFDIDKTEPKLFFTDFLILNQEVNSGDTIGNKIILNEEIEYTKEIELDYKHNSFSIGFVGVHYNAPQKHNYRYMLEGFDKEWYKASPEYRIAKYTNIPDGTYTFKVMGSNSDNIWSSQPIEIKIRINPPLYRSNKAFALYTLLLGLLAFFTYKIAKTVSQRKRDLLLANVEKNKVEEISKAKLQFFTNISHEFRTPLSLISAPLEQLITGGKQMPEDKQEYNLKVIKHNAGLMMRLVNQLLDFRKLDQNKLRLKPSKQNINDFLENIFSAFELLAKQRNINYQYKSITSMTDIWIDVEKMEKVVYNILSNAFKFTPDCGQIILKADINTDKKLYTISVSDTGSGIQANESEHIFERYYQSSGKSNVGGTGIGLALSKGIVDLHKGKIGFKANNPQGTIFFVEIKAGNEHLPQEALTSEQLSQQILMPEYETMQKTIDIEEVNSAQTSQHKLLIVEDNYELRKQLKDIFRSEYLVIEADNGKIGIEQCIQQQPDIIISDVMMPEMDGIEMCKHIKQDEATSHIPVLLLTAKNTDDTRVDGYEIGADGYLAKPFNINVLKARLKSLMDNREKMRLRFQKDIEINPEIISNTPADTRFLEKILTKIEENLSESEYSVEQLAEDYGVSRIYLNRKIKALTGETTNQFMRNIRLKHAAELLKQNKLNISEVTWKVGYNDLRTFRKRFKEKFGMSPSEYAKQYKE